MKLMKRSTLTEEQKDGIREIGNIGSGRASIYLSEIVDERVDISIPEVDIVELPTSITEIPEMFGEETGSTIVGTFMSTRGLEGGFVLGFQKKDFLNFLHRADVDVERLDVEARKHIKEVGEKVADFYLQAVADFFALDIEHDTPRLVNLPMGTLLAHIASQINAPDSNSEALVVKNIFDIGEDTRGDIILVLKIKEKEKVVRAIEERASGQ